MNFHILAVVPLPLSAVQEHEEPTIIKLSFFLIDCAPGFR